KEAQSRGNRVNFAAIREAHKETFCAREKTLECFLGRRCEIVKLLLEKGLDLGYRGDHLPDLFEYVFSYSLRMFGCFAPQWCSVHEHEVFRTHQAWEGWTLDFIDIYLWMHLEMLFQTILDFKSEQQLEGFKGSPVARSNYGRWLNAIQSSEAAPFVHRASYGWSFFGGFQITPAGMLLNSILEPGRGCYAPWEDPCRGRTGTFHTRTLDARKYALKLAQMLL